MACCEIFFENKKQKTFVCGFLSLSLLISAAIVDTQFLYTMVYSGAGGLRLSRLSTLRSTNEWNDVFLVKIYFVGEILKNPVTYAQCQVKW